MKKVVRLIAIVAGVFSVSAGAAQGEKILKRKISVKHKSFQDAGRAPQDVCGGKC